MPHAVVCDIEQLPCCVCTSMNCLMETCSTSTCRSPLTSFLIHPYLASLPSCSSRWSRETTWSANIFICSIFPCELNRTKSTYSLWYGLSAQPAHKFMSIREKPYRITFSKDVPRSKERKRKKERKMDGGWINGATQSNSPSLVVPVTTDSTAALADSPPPITCTTSTRAVSIFSVAAMRA